MSGPGRELITAALRYLCRSATRRRSRHRTWQEMPRGRQAAVRGLPSGVIQIDPLAGGSDFFAAADLK